jgi:hypothetical protein
MMLLALAISITAAALVSQSASAKCGGINDPPCPDRDKKVKPTATDVPTETPTPEQNAQPIIQTVVVTPDADQLALLCANVVPPPGGGNGSGAGNPNPPEPTAPRILPFIEGWGGPWSVGIIGVLTGILIGLLLPAIMRGFAGRQGANLGRALPGDQLGGSADKFNQKAFVKIEDGAAKIIGPVDMPGGGAAKAAVDYFDKPGGDAAKVFPKVESGGGGEAGFGKLAPPPPGSVGNAAKMQDYHDTPGGDAAKMQDYFDKPGGGAAKLAPPPPGSVGDVDPSDPGFLK